MTPFVVIFGLIFGVGVFSTGFLFGMDFGIYLGKKESEDTNES
jgi:hypothetical protein